MPHDPIELGSENLLDHLVFDQAREQRQNVLDCVAYLDRGEPIRKMVGDSSSERRRRSNPSAITIE